MVLSMSHIENPPRNHYVDKCIYHKVLHYFVYGHTRPLPTGAVLNMLCQKWFGTFEKNIIQKYMKFEDLPFSRNTLLYNGSKKIQLGIKTHYNFCMSIQCERGTL